jgi:NADH dehydrogenase (ubiquinone) 1 alpha subcomplex subunit 9
MKATRAFELCRSSSAVYGSNPLLAGVNSTCKIDYIKRNIQHDGRQEVPEDIPTAAKSSILGNLKRGRGGRSSFSGIVATVFGASGFVGPYVVNELGKTGSQIIVAHRCDPYDVRPLKPMGDLGQVLFHQCDLRDENAIKKSMKYSNTVINLVGRDFQTKSFTFEQVHVEGARRLARIAKECGVERFIHLSALNCSETPTPILLKKGSQFLASKARGEKAVLEEFPTATIFRPADIFGFEDRLLNYYKDWFRRIFTYMPLYKWGEKTVKQPVYVGDVARAIVNSITDPDAPGRIYEAVGPRRYVLAEMVDWFYRVLRRSPELWGYIRGPLDPITMLKHSMSEYLTITHPKMGWERAEREYVTDKRVPGLLDLEDLGINPLKSLEEYAPWHLRSYRAFNYYSDELGEFPTPKPPQWMPDERETELWKLYHQPQPRQ